MVYTAPSDGSLWVHDTAFVGNPWQRISAPASFTAISATLNHTHHAVVFALPDDTNVWENNPDFGGWTQISS